MCSKDALEVSDMGIDRRREYPVEPGTLQLTSNRILTRLFQGQLRFGNWQFQRILARSVCGFADKINPTFR